MFTFTRRSDVTTISAAITDQDPAYRLRSRSNSTPSGGWMFQPTRVTLTLSRRVPQQLSTPAVSVHVSGPHVQRNGDPGTMTLSTDFSSTGRDALPLEDMPPWLADWVDDGLAGALGLDDVADQSLAVPLDTSSHQSLD